MRKFMFLIVFSLFFLLSFLNARTIVDCTPKNNGEWHPFHTSYLKLYCLSPEFINPDNLTFEVKMSVKQFLSREVYKGDEYYFISRNGGTANLKITAHAPNYTTYEDQKCSSLPIGTYEKWRTKDYYYTLYKPKDRCKIFLVVEIPDATPKTPKNLSFVDKLEFEKKHYYQATYIYDFNSGETKTINLPIKVLKGRNRLKIYFWKPYDIHKSALNENDEFWFNLTFEPKSEGLLSYGECNVNDKAEMCGTKESCEAIGGKWDNKFRYCEKDSYSPVNNNNNEQQKDNKQETQKQEKHSEDYNKGFEAGKLWCKNHPVECGVISKDNMKIDVNNYCASHSNNCAKMVRNTIDNFCIKNWKICMDYLNKENFKNYCASNLIDNKKFNLFIPKLKIGDKYIWASLKFYKKEGNKFLWYIEPKKGINFDFLSDD